MTDNKLQAAIDRRINDTYSEGGTGIIEHMEDDATLATAFIERHLAGATGTEAKIIDLIYVRQKIGILKYGTTVADNPLTLVEWLRHARDEALDQAIYLERAASEIEQEDGK
jgi:hypothetical protein